MNYEPQTTNYESQATSDERRGFTLIELVVAIALLAVVIFFTGSIFRVAISSYRMAGAQAEVMQKLRAITGQLNSDFKGLRKDAPMFVWFHKGPNGSDDPNRFDQIMFFADGDFQSTLLYGGGIPKVPSIAGAPIVSNVARIQYCQASIYSPIPIARYYNPWEQQGIDDPNRFLNINHRTLARRQHLLTADTDYVNWPVLTDFFNTFDDDTSPVSEIKINDALEHDLLSLSQWQSLMTNSTNINQVLNVCFGQFPKINFVGANGLHMLMSEGVSNFSVQWGYLYTNAGQTYIYWWPSIDPDGNPNTADSDFSLMTRDAFGVYFNIPAGISIPYWNHPDGAIFQSSNTFSANFFPPALKFTFTLYDSKGVFKDGQTFTHIVYIGD